MYAIRILNVLVMIFLPIGIASYITSKFKSNWNLWWIGGGVFILSQIGHIPFNYFSSILLNRSNLVYWSRSYQVIFNALFLGLSAGIWEETARYFAFRKWVGKKKTFQEGIQLGVGHGSFESIIMGLLVLYTFVQMVVIKDIDISNRVPANEHSQIMNEISVYWSTPWYIILLGGLERVFVLPTQIAFSVIMVQVFIQRKGFWFWIAVFYHTLVDAIAVLLMSYTSIYTTEMTILLFAVISIGIIYKFRSQGPYELEQDSNRYKESIYNDKPIMHELDETTENLNATKYQ